MMQSKTVSAISSLFFSLAPPAQADEAQQRAKEKILAEHCETGTSVVFHGYDTIGEHNNPRLIFAYCASDQVVIMSCFSAIHTQRALENRLSDIRNGTNTQSSASVTRSQITEFQRGINTACDIEIT